ncbi:stage II sporulation protein E [Babesia caballi]|uniref:Stage II sporulation protein E n=1 Tax=Babesia caballi TaxID=5871 RepID=A0AAV4LSC2_BABCB|nr:stage II sporulation protein E [Babesia caballi]
MMALVDIRAQLQQNGALNVVKELFTHIINNPNAFYTASTVVFSLLFLLIFGYYRLRGLAKDYHNIVMIKRNLERIAKERLKRYLLQSAEFYY